MSKKEKKFRKGYTSSGKLMLGGKNAEQNEELIKQVSPDGIVLHTKNPGSPFVNIKGKASKRDIHEAALFCARFSRDWKKNKKDVEVHYFFGRDIYKEEDMPLGTFGVKRARKIIIKKEELISQIKKEMIKNEE